MYCPLSQVGFVLLRNIKMSKIQLFILQKNNQKPTAD